MEKITLFIIYCTIITMIAVCWTTAKAEKLEKELTRINDKIAPN